MILVLLAYFGGVLTIVSPCILPVLPFVFARADRPFVSSGLPLLAGMAATFAVVATLAAVGGGWVVEANQYGRIAAIALLAVFGVTLLFPALSDRMTRPPRRTWCAPVAIGRPGLWIRCLDGTAAAWSPDSDSTSLCGRADQSRTARSKSASSPLAFRPMRLPSADMRGHQCPNPVQPRP
jgi:cytochrome c biogenesis protein CcdA